MSIKNLPKYKDIRGSIRRKGRYPDVGTTEKDTHVIHHSLTKTGTPEAFANHHIDSNGWPGIAYHFVIQQDGTIYQCDDLDRRTYHAGNTNTRAIGTCVVGDFRKGSGQTPTQPQMESLYLLNKELFDGKELPNMKYVKGHQECPGYSWKNCPGDGWNYRKVINGDLVTSDDVIATSPSKPAPLPNEYVIQEGDTFWSISKEHPGLSVAKLQDLNPSVKPTELREGMVIKLGGTVAKPTPAKPVKPSEPAKPSKPANGAIVPYPGLLKRGSEGKEVERLQRALNIKADGNFGPATEKAVKSYQVRHGLEDDGKVGKITWNTIF
jgi:LysM repeat protein